MKELNTKKNEEEGVYLIESMKDYYNYMATCFLEDKSGWMNNLASCVKSERDFVSYSDELLEDEPHYSLCEDVIYNKSLLLNKIITYAEHLPIERIEEVKTIQLMLFTLFGKDCDKKDYKRICNLTTIIENKSRKTINIQTDMYVENLNKQINKYGKRRKNNNS